MWCRGATSFITWVPWSSHGMTQGNKVQSSKSKVQMLCRCATSPMTWVPVSSKSYDLGPGVKHRDDKFLSFFILRFFLYRHPGAGRDPLHRRYLCRIRDGINYLGPVVKPRDDTREQSSKCKVQSANVVSLRDKFYYLGPGVKHRDDMTSFFLTFLFS